MDVTLSDIERTSPEVAARVRDAIRQGQLKAARKPGVAGRPYLVRTDDVVAWDAGLEPVMRRVMTDVEEAPADDRPRSMPVRPARLRAGRRMDAGPHPSPLMGSGADRMMSLDRMLAVMEAQAGMMRTLVDGMQRASALREERLDKMQDELQQMSYKLGQAHQEIGRLERHLAERQGILGRAGEA
jgi:hypothetical protein